MGALGFSLFRIVVTCLGQQLDGPTFILTYLALGLSVVTNLATNISIGYYAWKVPKLYLGLESSLKQLIVDLGYIGKPYVDSLRMGANTLGMKRFSYLFWRVVLPIQLYLYVFFSIENRGLA